MGFLGGFCCKPYGFWGVLIFAPIWSSPSLEIQSTPPPPIPLWDYDIWWWLIVYSLTKVTSGFASGDNFFYNKEGKYFSFECLEQARYIAHWEAIFWRPLKKTITVNSVLACPSANCQWPMLLSKKPLLLVCSHVTRGPCWCQYKTHSYVELVMKMEFSPQRGEKCFCSWLSCHVQTSNWIRFFA